MTVFYTSDNHFFHRNIVKFENRPFESVEEMNQAMIDVWNSVVKDNDYVMHLGDFVFGGYDKWRHVLDQLNGKIILHKGNHDDSKKLKKLFKEGYFKKIHEVGSYKKINKHQLWFTHYPLDIGLRPRKWSIHGHLHSTMSNSPNQINVGVDTPILGNIQTKFGVPISEEELIDYLDRLTPDIEERFLKNRSL